MAPRPHNLGPASPVRPATHQGQLAVRAPLVLIGDDVTGNTQGTAQAFGQGQVGVCTMGQELLHNLDTDRLVSWPAPTRPLPPLEMARSKPTAVPSAVWAAAGAPGSYPWGLCLLLAQRRWG